MPWPRPARDDVSMIYGADLRYFGQQNELTISFERDPREGRDIGMIRRNFEAAYLAQYGVNPSHVPVEIVSWRLTVRGPDIASQDADTLPREAGKPKAHRPVLLWPDAGQVAVYDRADLASGQLVEGPAIVEERETTIVIPPHWEASVNAIGCVVAKRRA
jgi:N-methylhydantoinase A